jgi:hypothetical protein
MSIGASDEPRALGRETALAQAPAVLYCVLVVRGRCRAAVAPFRFCAGAVAAARLPLNAPGHFPSNSETLFGGGR